MLADGHRLAEIERLPLPDKAVLLRLYQSRQIGPGMLAMIAEQQLLIIGAIGALGGQKPRRFKFSDLFPDLSGLLEPRKNERPAQDELAAAQDKLNAYFNKVAADDKRQG